MEINPDKSIEQFWTIPIDAWPKLAKKGDVWQIEMFYGAVVIPVEEELAVRMVDGLNSYYQAEWEREKEARKQGE